MSRKTSDLVLLLSVCLLVIFTSVSDCLPLSTNKRWIVDDKTGKRVKLVCTHWVAHERVMLAEGLYKLPLNDIVAQVRGGGFNCVRLSYATYMFTRYANQSVAKSIAKAGIPKNITDGIKKYNPWVMNMTHLQAYEAVVHALHKHRVMILIDNHISEPEWCCNNNDGNGFFGDKQFHPDEWLKGLVFVASHFKGIPNVVAIDLRNELRGARQNDHDWYKYVSKATTSIHKINPDVLIVVSGLNFDSDFTFLKDKPLDLNLGKKLVYEFHLYSFSGPSQDRWILQPLNRVCAATIKSLNANSAFLMSGENPAPLFLSEFGYDMRGLSQADNNFVPCLVAYAASVDLDWSLWAFGGTYYHRQGHFGSSETYALLDDSWKHHRDPKFSQKFQLMQRITQDPASNMARSQIMFHPLSGECVHVNKDNELEMGNCKNPSRWSYEGAGSPIRLMGSALCLKANCEGNAPTLSKECLSPKSAWHFVSESGLHLATMEKKGEPLCLQKKNQSEIVTTKCICIEDDSACMDNPQSQWFQLVSINVD